MDKQEYGNHKQQAGRQVYECDIFHFLNPLKEPDGQHKLVECQQKRKNIHPIMILKERNHTDDR